MLRATSLLVCCTVCCCTAVVTAGPVDIFVSPTGKDSNDGKTAATPLATLLAAQAASRAAVKTAGGQSDGVTVHLNEGVYQLDAPLNFTTEDSGTDTAPVAWVGEPSRAAGGFSGTSAVAPATISGGQAVSFAAAAGGLWKADVSGLPTQAVAYGRQLYVNDRRAPRSTEPGSYDCEKTATSPCTKSKTLWGDTAWQITNTTV